MINNFCFNTPAHTTNEETKDAINKWLEKHKRYWADAPNEYLLDKHEYIFHEIFSMMDVEPRGVPLYIDSLVSLRFYLNKLIGKNKIQSTILPSLLEWQEEIEHIYLLMTALDDNCEG